MRIGRKIGLVMQFSMGEIRNRYIFVITANGKYYLGDSCKWKDDITWKCGQDVTLIQLVQEKI